MDIITTLSILYKKIVRKHILYKVLDNKERVLRSVIINNIKIARSSLLAIVSKLLIDINNKVIKNE